LSSFDFTVSFTIIRRPLDAVWLLGAFRLALQRSSNLVGVRGLSARCPRLERSCWWYSLSEAVPAPGGVAAITAFVQATTFFAAADDRAVAAAVVLHAISFLPITFVGLIFAAREGLTLGSMPNLTSMEPNAPIGSHEQLASANLKPSTN
jgi:hypothetical protein